MTQVNGELFQQSLLELSAVEQKLLAHKELLKELNRSYYGKLELIITECDPPCSRAIQQFNSVSKLLIIPYTLRISFNVPEMKIDLFARICYKDHEEIDDNAIETVAIERINRHLAPFVESALSEAGIPLTFGKLSSTSNYYTK